jgi:hypothetical protein
VCYGCAVYCCFFVQSDHLAEYNIQQQQQQLQHCHPCASLSYVPHPTFCNLPALQYVVVELPGVPALLLRVTATNTLTTEEQQDVLGYHCFR